MELNACWLSGTPDGLYRSEDGTGWTRVGAYPFRITSIKRRDGRTVVSAGSGLFEVGPDADDRWLQLHDETLTEVLDFAWMPGDPGIAAGTAYGLAFGNRDTSGAVRWRFLSGSLPVNARFTNAILKDGDRFLAGTEGGLLVYDGAAWTETTLNDGPVRALLRIQDGFLAGADDRGVWESVDGVGWTSLGLAPVTVYALAESDGDLLAGTERGVFRRDVSGAWSPVGPDARVATLAVMGGTWMAGCVPGGVWMSRDAGATWQQGSGAPSHVESLLPPKEAA